VKKMHITFFSDTPWPN